MTTLCKKIHEVYHGVLIYALTFPKQSDFRPNCYFSPYMKSLRKIIHSVGSFFFFNLFFFDQNCQLFLFKNK